MRNGFNVVFTDEAEEDLNRLFDHLIDRAQTVEDLLFAVEASQALRAVVESQLGRHPMVFRKADDNPFLRELIVPLGATGYVALFEVQGARQVTVLALRHQREDDYH